MVYGLVFTGKRKGRKTSEMRYGKDLFKTKAKAEKARKYDIDQDWLISQYIDTINDARAVKHFNVVKGCIDSIAKLTGHLLDRRELAISGEISHLQQLDTETLMNALQTAQKTPAIEGEFRNIGND